MPEKEVESERRKSGDGREGFALQMEVEMTWVIMEVMSSLKYLGSCFSKKGGPQKDLKIRVSVGLKGSGAMKLTFYVWSLSLDMKRELYEKVVVPTVTYEADAHGIRMNE